MRPIRPKVVCLCGSIRFRDEFIQANYDETMQGNIVLSVGYVHHIPEVATGMKSFTKEEKKRLDWLHFHKIDLAQKVVFLNKGGYMGESTTEELAYSVFSRKEIAWYDQTMGEQWMIRERRMLGAMIAVLADGLPHLDENPRRGLATWARLEKLWEEHQYRQKSAQLCETCGLAARLRSQGETTHCKIHETEEG